MSLNQEQRTAVREIVKDLAHPDNGMAGVHAVIDFWEENPGLYEAVHQPDEVTGLNVMNPGPDGARMAEKMLRNVARSAQDYVTGVQNPRADFKAAALAANGKWKDSVQRAAAEDRFAKGMQGVDVAEAIRIATSDGGAAFTAGVAKRKDKITAAMNRLAPKLGAISQQIRQMPQNTPEDRAQRMLRNLELMRGIKGTAGN